MNKVIKEDGKVKVSLYQIGNIIDKFIKKESSITISKVMKLNRNTVNRYINEIRKIIFQSEEDRFEHLLVYQEPIVKLVWLENPDNEESALVFYLYIIRNQYVYINLNNDEDTMMPKITLDIKDDCKKGYLYMFKKELSDIEMLALENICYRLKKQVRLYKSTIHLLMVEEAFRMNVLSDGSILTKKYVKDILRDYPLFSEKGF